MAHLSGSCACQEPRFKKVGSALLRQQIITGLSCSYITPKTVLPYFFPPRNAQSCRLRWMDKILHHLETMGNHCSLVLTGESFSPGPLSWCRIPSIHSITASTGFLFAAQGESATWRDRSCSLCDNAGTRAAHSAFAKPALFAPPLPNRRNRETTTLFGPSYHDCQLSRTQIVKERPAPYHV